MPDADSPEPRTIEILPATELELRLLISGCEFPGLARRLAIASLAGQGDNDLYKESKDIEICIDRLRVCADNLIDFIKKHSEQSQVEAQLGFLYEFAQSAFILGETTGTSGGSKAILEHDKARKMREKKQAPQRRDRMIKALNTVIQGLTTPVQKSREFAEEIRDPVRALLSIKDKEDGYPSVEALYKAILKREA